MRDSDAYHRPKPNIPEDPNDRDLIRFANEAWLEHQEQDNGIRIPRHDQSGCYTNQDCRGGVLLFVDKNFMATFQACPYRREVHPGWNFDGPRDEPFEVLGAKLPTLEEMREEMKKIRALERA